MADSQFWITKKNVYEKQITRQQKRTVKIYLHASRPYELLVSIDIKINEHTSPSRLMYVCTYTLPTNQIPCEFRWLRRVIFFMLFALFRLQLSLRRSNMKFFFAVLRIVCTSLGMCLAWKVLKEKQYQNSKHIHFYSEPDKNFYEIEKIS